MTATQEANYAHAWEPDWHVVDAVVSRRKGLDDLDLTDRCVVVAGLTHRGRSVNDIAEHLGCCTRVVKRLRAQPLTAALTHLLEAEQRADNAERRTLAQSAAHDRTTAAIATERDRYRRQANDLFQALAHRRGINT